MSELSQRQRMNDEKQHHEWFMDQLRHTSVHVVMELTGNEHEIDGADIIGVFAEPDDAVRCRNAQPMSHWVIIREIWIQ